MADVALDDPPTRKILRHQLARTMAELAGPERDLGLGKLFIKETQGARRVPDVADVAALPQAAEGNARRARRPDPPRAVQPAFGEDQGFHRLIGALRKLVRPMAADGQALQSLGGLPLQVLVAGLAADAKLLAQLVDRETVTLRQDNESIDFIHVGYVFPGHRALGVTHHSGLYHLLCAMRL